MLAKDRVVLSKIWVTGYWLWSRLPKCVCCLLQFNEQLFRLSFYQQWVGSGAASLSAAHLQKCEAMPKGDLWDMFVSGINAFCEIWASTPYQKLEVPESQLYINASCPSLCCSCGKKICLMQGSRGFGHGVVVSKNCNGMLILLLCVAASLSAACVWKMWLTPEKRFMRHVCLRNPFLPLLLGIPSIHSLPEAGSWER